MDDADEVRSWDSAIEDSAIELAILLSFVAVIAFVWKSTGWQYASSTACASCLAFSALFWCSFAGSK